MSRLLISCLAVGLCNEFAHTILLLRRPPQMLDRENKREKILEGKLREIKIKLKKQQEQQALELLRQAEKTSEDIKAQEEAPKAKPSLEQSRSSVVVFCH